MDRLEAAEVLARMLYNPEREYAFTEKEMTAIKWAISDMRRLEKRRKELKDIERGNDN